MIVHLKTRGLTIIDVLAALLALTMLLAIVVPALARGRSDSGVEVSLNNLRQISTALDDYAADFNGRQPTAVVDDFSAYGADGGSTRAFEGRPQQRHLLTG